LAARPSVAVPSDTLKDAPEGVPSSLAYKYQSVPPRDLCPRSGGRWVNLDSGESYWDACKRHSCLVCGPKAAHVTGLAIAVAVPERFVRLSRVGDSWSTIRSRVKRLTYDVRSAGFSWNVAWHVERNPRGTGHHIHAFQWGDFISQRRLQELTARRGMGFPDIRAWHQVGTVGTAYGMKAATGYGMKGAGEALTEYLAINGGRLVHASRGFWRDGPEGGRLAGIDAARAVAVGRVHGPREPGLWRLVGWRELVKVGNETALSLLVGGGENDATTQVHETR
jgi:hypothetical protein